ncbi:MAG: sigma-54 dependent transcriptional regulator [Gracilimonas sp.]|nr:sigma-54 dependent transcriptional regulator [Gracilimonas sp.]
MSKGDNEWIHESAEITELKRKALRVAKSKVPVLLTGENGTGKEVLAHFIHNNSAPKEVVDKKPFIIVNCGAMPEDLIESELFGYDKGAFTGADTNKEGAFELADGGTLFLDEVGELSLNAQVKLLRAVEYQSFRRLGGKKEIKVDVRIISATNVILHDAIKAGDFRQDLFYRLNVIELYVPALRHRKDEIPLLTEHFLKVFSEKYNINKLYIDKDCLACFKRYNWPGNVRELKNIIERCVVLSKDGVIDKSVLPPHIVTEDCMRSVNNSSNNNRTAKHFLEIEIGTPFDEIEKKVIHQTLSSCNNNKSEAANILGVSRKTLHNKLNKYESTSEEIE